jgi:peroxidase
MSPHNWLQALFVHRFSDTRIRRPRQRRRPCQLELLEDRAMMAADLRSIDGTGNNLSNPTWGSAGADLLRLAPAEYTDGISTPAGANRPSARIVSDLLASQEDDLLNDRDLSAFVYVWGQFLDHDLDQTVNGTPADVFSVTVPAGDPFFDPTGTGTQTIYLARSAFDSATGTSTSNPRQQVNSLTAFLDGSQVYGSDSQRAAALRTFVGGRLKTSAGDLLPFNTMGLANDNPLGAPAQSLFVAGDVRANENIELTAMHTLFVREHNRWADKLAAAHPGWTDEQIYQQARRLVIAEMQAITYNEFLPALLGHALPAYRGYNPQVNPGIANEFSTAAFRLGHSLLGADVEFLDNQGEETRDELSLRDAFFNPSVLTETGIDPILKYLASDRAQELDTHVVDDVRNFLFGQPGQGGLDLVSLNLQRGRDHGLADYNATRVAYGLKPVTSFAEITNNAEVQAALREAYGDVNNIDLWVGALAEDHIKGGSVGPLIDRILTDQFTRLRDGDRFWYQRDLTLAEQRLVRGTSLADIVAMNSTTTNLQDNVFVFEASVSGRVTLAPDRLAALRRTTDGVAGATVDLLDATGAVVASTVTNRTGNYTFDHLDLGTYTVRVTFENGQVLPQQREVELTRGQVISAINFAVGTKPTTTKPDRRDRIGDISGAPTGRHQPSTIGPTFFRR